MALPEFSSLPSCRGLTDLFFDDDESLATIYDCRSVCFTCPQFERCAENSVENYPDHEQGIFAGMPGSTRQAIFKGDHEFVDWRETWDPTRHVVEGLAAPLEIREPCRYHARFKTQEDGSRTCVICGTRVRLMQRR